MSGMISSKIDMATIQKLMKGDSRSSEPTRSTSYKERWPGEVNMIKLAKAVDRRAEYVLFLGSRRFKITYLPKDVVLIKPADWFRFVPMGYFARKTLKEALINNVDPDDL